MPIQAALNGGRRKDRHPAVPTTPEELAVEAAACAAVGAAGVHVHPRDAQGRETLEPEACAAAIAAIRAAVPGLPVGLSTGLWIPPGGAERRAAIQAWTTAPDLVSINLCEGDAPEVAAIALDRGIAIEAGIWSQADLERLLAMPWRGSIARVVVEANEQDPAEALAVYAAIVRGLAAGGIEAPIMAHGLDAGFWPVAEAAARDGFDLRVGFEDVLLLPDGTPAASNAELVAALVAART